MSAKEGNCNGSGKSLRSSGERFITYKRKRARSSPPEDASVSASASEVSNKPLSKEITDVGWNYGAQDKGSMICWHCKWCGITRAGDGLSRLKQQFPGARLDMNENNVTQQLRRVTRHSEARKEQPWTATQTSKMCRVKAMKEPLDTLVYSSYNEQDRSDSIGGHWRTLLEHMLQFLDVSEGDGIHECICDALRAGPSGFTRNCKLVDPSDDSTELKDRYEDNCKMQDQPQRPGSSENASSDLSKAGTCGQAYMNDNTRKCQNVLFNILCSEKFALLCDLLCRNFKDSKAKEIVDFSLINSKMKNGDYREFPGLFDQDIQQVWKRLQDVGEEMLHLASSLSNMPMASYEKQETCQVGVEQRNSMDSNTTTQLPCDESERSTKADQTEASCLHKACTCKQCGAEADLTRSLICDGCEAMYHFSCIQPAVEEIPTRSWYCASCDNKANREESPPSRRKPPLLITSQQQQLHEECAVCDRLEVHDQLGERRSVSTEETAQPAVSRLCKKCGTCEDEDKRFLICGNADCEYRFYHIRCLQSNQIASEQQQGQPCWYCPSCLCRVCFLDKDDDKIVLCDGCDEGYHTYCMKPPRACVPGGQWYCTSCNVGRARAGMRRYEKWILERHGANRSLDMLLCAAEKLSSDDR